MGYWRIVVDQRWRRGAQMSRLQRSSGSIRLRRMLQSEVLQSRVSGNINSRSHPFIHYKSTISNNDAAKRLSLHVVIMNESNRWAISHPTAINHNEFAVH